MTITDDMIERAAEAAFNKYWNSGDRLKPHFKPRPWLDLVDSSRALWRDVARAALEAALSGKEG